MSQRMIILLAIVGGLLLYFFSRSSASAAQLSISSPALSPGPAPSSILSGSPIGALGSGLSGLAAIFSRSTISGPGQTLTSASGVSQGLQLQEAPAGSSLSGPGGATFNTPIRTSIVGPLAPGEYTNGGSLEYVGPAPVIAGPQPNLAGGGLPGLPLESAPAPSIVNESGPSNNYTSPSLESQPGGLAAAATVPLPPSYSVPASSGLEGDQGFTYADVVAGNLYT